VTFTDKAARELTTRISNPPDWMKWKNKLERLLA
jgi:hypothetical protein